jgi:hypothetical protein
MGAGPKKRQTMAKMTRERMVKERQARKREKKDEKKQAAADARRAEVAELSEHAVDDETDTPTPANLLQHPRSAETSLARDPATWPGST